MDKNNLVRFAILGDPVTHFARGAFPHVTLCGAGTEHGKAWATPRNVDCMTCLVRANDRPIEDIIATTLRLPKEFLYGESEDKGSS